MTAVTTHQDTTLGAALDTGMVAFDLETTGPLPDSARVVTAALVRLTNGPGGWTKDPTGWLLDPGVPIPAGATAVHGITTDHAREHGTDPAQGIAGVLADLQAAWDTGTPVVTHNGSYDLTVMDREARRHGLEPPRPGVLIDTMVLDKAVDPYRKGKRTLVATAEHYGITLGDAHDATADAIAAVRIAWVLTRRYPDIAAMSLSQLHDAQVRWRAEQSASLEQYFRRKDPGAVVDGTWPIHPLPDGWDPQAVDA